MSDFAYRPPNATNTYGPPTAGRSFEMNELHRAKVGSDVGAMVQGRGNAIGEMLDESERRLYAPRPFAPDTTPPKG